MKIQNNNEAISKKLFALIPKLTEQDICLAAAEMPCNYDTVKRYLKRGVPETKVEFGKKLYNYLKQKSEVAA